MRTSTWPGPWTALGECRGHRRVSAIAAHRVRPCLTHFDLGATLGRRRPSPRGHRLLSGSPAPATRLSRCSEQPGQCVAARGQVRGGRDLLCQGDESRTGGRTGRNNYGGMLLAQGKTDRAVACFQQAIQRDPTSQRPTTTWAMLSCAAHGRSDFLLPEGHRVAARFRRRPGQPAAGP